MTTLKTMKVLYAEDEVGIREQVSCILSFFFKEVIVASNGNEAFLYYEEHNPDILILDICMPELDGLELLRKIRLNNKYIPAIMLTAHTENPYLLRAVELNITRYLVKPFSKDSLTDALNECSKLIFQNVQKIDLKNNYTFNFALKTLTHLENNIQLTSNELKLIEILSINPQKTHSFESLIKAIWGWEDVSKEALKSLVKGIRKKLPYPLIHNVFGVGYTMKQQL